MHKVAAVAGKRTVYSVDAGVNRVRNMATYTVTMLRHGESAWNAENRFCGWFDADLAESGVEEAKKAAKVCHVYGVVAVNENNNLSGWYFVLGPN